MVSMDGLDPLTLSDGAPERAATKTVVATGYPTSPSVNLGSWEMEPADARQSSTPAIHQLLACDFIEFCGHACLPAASPGNITGSVG